jgi:hypothetical protein
MGENELFLWDNLQVCVKISLHLNKHKFWVISNLPYILVGTSPCTWKGRWDFIATISSIKSYFPLVYHISHYVWYLPLAFPRKNNKIIWHPNTKALFFFSYLQFSCFPPKTVPTKVKHETSLKNSVKQFLSQIREPQRHKFYCFRIMKQVKITERSEYFL